MRVRLSVRVRVRVRLRLRVGWLESRVRSKMRIEGPLKNEGKGESDVEG